MGGLPHKEVGEPGLARGADQQVYWRAALQMMNVGHKSIPIFNMAFMLISVERGAEQHVSWGAALRYAQVHVWHVRAHADMLLSFSFKGEVQTSWFTLRHSSAGCASA
eukprot:1142088-Pelagomonas_calceolata.AAC.5